MKRFFVPFEEACKNLRSLLENVDIAELLTHHLPEVRLVGQNLKEKLEAFEKKRKVSEGTPRTISELRDSWMEECLSHSMSFEDLDEID